MNDRRRIVLGIAGVCVVLLVCFTAAFGITSYIFNHTGRLHPLAEFIITCYSGFLIFAISISIFNILMNKRNRPVHERIHSDLLRVMNRIAQGDFNVFIDVRESGPHRDIAEGINKMAKGLGSMERMRQDFISNVSHEIQSPLTSISGFARLLKDETLTFEEKNHYLEIIETESKRLSHLSENLLKLSALETGDEPPLVKEFRLDKQLESAALMLEPQWTAKKISVEADLPKILYQGNEGLLSQVWINLLHNAVKFTPEGGIIRISLTPIEKEIRCQISDTGIGIAPEDQIHIFERFYKVDKARDRSLGGNGLGLSLVKKIVDLHGGHISLTSEIDHGTTFQVILPINIVNPADKTS